MSEVINTCSSHKIHSIDTVNGVPLLFQHGLAAQVGQIEGLLSDIPEIRLMAIDCPGHGQSILPSGFRPSFNNYADDVISFLNERGIKKAFFGGLSMGSGIALNIAIRYPDRVQGLILLRPAWLDKGHPPNLLKLLEVLPLLNDPNGRIKFQRTDVYRKMKLRNPGAALSFMGVFADTQQVGLPVVIQSMVEDRPIEDLRLLKKIDVPSVILANEDDPLHPLKIGTLLQGKLKSSEFIKVISRYIDNDLHRTQVRNAISEFIISNS